MVVRRLGCIGYAIGGLHAGQWHSYSRPLRSFSPPFRSLHSKIMRLGDGKRAQEAHSHKKTSRPVGQLAELRALIMRGLVRNGLLAKFEQDERTTFSRNRAFIGPKSRSAMLQQNDDENCGFQDCMASSMTWQQQGGKRPSPVVHGHLSQAIRCRHKMTIPVSNRRRETGKRLKSQLNSCSIGN